MSPSQARGASFTGVVPHSQLRFMAVVIGKPLLHNITLFESTCNMKIGEIHKKFSLTHRTLAYSMFL